MRAAVVVTVAVVLGALALSRLELLVIWNVALPLYDGTAGRSDLVSELRWVLGTVAVGAVPLALILLARWGDDA